MTDLETRLQQALSAGDPPPRDPMFRVEILLRRERAAFRRQLLTGGAIALGTAVVAAVGFSAIDRWVRPGPEWLAAVAAAAVVLTACLAAPHLGSIAALRSLAGRWRAPRLWL